MPESGMDERSWLFKLLLTQSSQCIWWNNRCSSGNAPPPNDCGSVEIKPDHSQYPDATKNTVNVTVSGFKYLSHDASDHHYVSVADASYRENGFSDPEDLVCDVRDEQPAVPFNAFGLVRSWGDHVWLLISIHSINPFIIANVSFTFDLIPNEPTVIPSSLPTTSTYSSNISSSSPLSNSSSSSRADTLVPAIVVPIVIIIVAAAAFFLWRQYRRSRLAPSAAFRANHSDAVDVMQRNGGTVGLGGTGMLPQASGSSYFPLDEKRSFTP